MATLSANAVKEVERWFLDNPAWFGLVPSENPSPPDAATAAPVDTAAATPTAVIDPPERAFVPPQPTPVP
jgi:hypothetical protein